MVREPLDVLIVGAGPVGLSLSLALAPSRLKLALVDARAPTAGEPDPAGAPSLALSFGTRQLLTGLGAWSGLAESAQPIYKIAVSQKGYWGSTILESRVEKVPALGYVLPQRELEQHLESLVVGYKLPYRRSMRLLGLRPEKDWITAEFDNQGHARSLTARLVVLASGTGAGLASRLGLVRHTRDYHQTALVSSLAASRAEEGLACERFTRLGPLALLPLNQSRYALVLSLDSRQAPEWMELSDAAFVDRVQGLFGQSLGRFSEPGSRKAYPLQLSVTEPPKQARCLLLGNARRSLHPVAGQGFNLALRDTAALAEQLLAVAQSAGDPGDPELRAKFCRSRHWDQRLTQGLTDGLVRLFGNSFPGLPLARALGLLALDILPPLKHSLARQTLGLNTRLPRLASRPD